MNALSHWIVAPPGDILANQFDQILLLAQIFPDVRAP